MYSQTDVPIMIATEFSTILYVKKLLLIADTNLASFWDCRIHQDANGSTKSTLKNYILDARDMINLGFLKDVIIMQVISY